MREIVVKKNGRIVIKVPFDPIIMDDYYENIDIAQENHVEVNVIGSDSSLPDNSAKIRVLRTGNALKSDKFSNDFIYWIEGEIIETNDARYSIGMQCWFKFPLRWILSHFRSDDAPMIPEIKRVFSGRQMIIEGLHRPSAKSSNGENVYFVSFNNASFRMV